MMNFNYLFLIISSLLYASFIYSKSCSRENSRIVRDFFKEAISSIYKKHDISIPAECIFSSKRDIFYHQELHKVKIRNNTWQCKYCNKVFYSEYYLDLHLSNRHNDTLVQNDQAVCLADYCSIFRCDVLNKAKQSHQFFNSFTRSSDDTKRKSKKSVNEQQFTILRSRCASIINECVPTNIKYEIRIQMQHEMYAEICAYLTNNRYYELPSCYKSFINLTSVFCSLILLGICIVGVGFVRRFGWKFGYGDDDEYEKPLSEETISTATALLAKSPRNSIIHSTKNSTSTVRHRVHFESPDESKADRLHSEYMST